MFKEVGSRFFYRVLRKTRDFKITMNCCAILSNNKKNQDVAVWLTARWHLLCCSWGIESMCRNHNNVEDISKIVIFLKKTGNVHSKWFWQLTICLVLCSAWVKALHTENLQAHQSSSPVSCSNGHPQICIPCLQDYEVFFHKRKGIAL